MVYLDGERLVDVVEAAEIVEKKHSDLLKDIRRCTKQLAEGKMALGAFFMENRYGEK